MSHEFTSAEVAILAGGRGQRMGELTNERQKCLLPVEGKPILGYVLDSLARAFGNTKVMVCLSYRAKDVYEYVSKNKPRNMVMDFIYDTGGQRTVDLFRSLEGKVKPPFIATAGDIILASDSVYVNAMHLAVESGASLGVSVSPRVFEADTHGVAKVRGNWVSEFQYPPPENPDQDHLRDMTIWGFGKSSYNYLEKFSEVKALSKVIAQSVKNGENVFANIYEDSWYHFANPEDLNKLHRDSSKS
jgi:NDP-sugar pyrophosphorylase family protein